ncbi:uncharacterized protein LOC129601771 [Paramacrobiotus metropolitanus]|uniref:uncharacterized protein LOC129601771 n=1 Tax=Paramacrobiotus metropolitanus TaxID=2943436 RepID=UPI0024461A75|nr:uncharacterized protein LOC129601771 [Paramacrobiotus metropolitanus]
MWLQTEGHRLVRSHDVLFLAVSNLVVSGVTVVLIFLTAGLFADWSWSGWSNSASRDFFRLHIFVLMYPLNYGSLGVKAYSGKFCNYKCEKHLTAGDRGNARQYFDRVFNINALALVTLVPELYHFVSFRLCMSTHTGLNSTQECWFGAGANGTGADAGGSSASKPHRAFVDFGYMYILIDGIHMANALFSMAMSTMIMRKMDTKKTTVDGNGDHENVGSSEAGTGRNQGMDRKDTDGPLLCIVCESERMTRQKEKQRQKNLQEINEEIVRLQALLVSAEALKRRYALLPIADGNPGLN